MITEVENVPRGLRELRPNVGTRMVTRSVASSALEVTASADDAKPALLFEVDLADAVGYWYPGHRSGRTLPPNWSGSTVTSLVHGAPVGALYDADGEVLLGWAAARGSLNCRSGSECRRNARRLRSRSAQAARSPGPGSARRHDA